MFSPVRPSLAIEILAIEILAIEITVNEDKVPQAVFSVLL
jgi:hypothetical protein